MSVVPWIDAERIAARVAELGEELLSVLDDRPVVAVVVLRGAFVFAADLVRTLAALDLTVAFVSARSYRGTTAAGPPELDLSDLPDLTGRHVLLLEDIADTGVTLSLLMEATLARSPGSLRVVVLLDKPERRKVSLVPDHVGFTIPDAFVVGYGLDLDGRHRHLPFVGVVEP